MECDSDFSLYIQNSIMGKKKNNNIEEQRNVIPELSNKSHESYQSDEDSPTHHYWDK